MRAATTGAVIVFDGDCGFCRRQMDWIRRRDRTHQFEFVSKADPELLQRFPVLREQQSVGGLRVIDAHGVVWCGADAVHQIARRLPYWGALAWLYRVPPLRWLAGRTYAWVAARRNRFAAACPAKSPPKRAESNT